MLSSRCVAVLIFLISTLSSFGVIYFSPHPVPFVAGTYLIMQSATLSAIVASLLWDD